MDCRNQTSSKDRHCWPATKVNLVRKSCTFQREGSHGASNPVFAPFRDESLTGFAEKGIVFIPAASPATAGLSNGVKNGVKEGTMKKLIYLTIGFLLMFTFIGCASTTSEQRKETYDLRQDVGNSQFVGSTKNLDAKGLMPMLAY
jgi:hypothetical protein